MDHKPGMEIGLPLTSFRVPMSEPEAGLNALILPSPKFPTNNDPAKSPKLAGATARPHGELSGPCEIRFAVRFPDISNTPTYPFPAPATSSCFAPSCLAYVT